MRFSLACLLCCFLPALLPAADTNWTYWRGPSGQGVVDDKDVPLTWSETENVLWKTPTPGVGSSSPIVWGDKIFLTSSSKTGDERSVFCVSLSTGKVLWQHTAAKEVAPEKSHGWNGFASPSCATNGKVVLAFFGTPGLFCYDLDGKLLWSHKFGLFTSAAGWGTAASPIIFEDLVIQNCDNDGLEGLPKDAKPADVAPSALVALELSTGKIRWQTARNQGRGFSTPRVFKSPNGRTELLLNGPNGLWSYDPATGQEIWHCERKAGGDSNKFGEPIPVFHKNLLFVPSGRPGPFQAVKPDGVGDVTKSHVVWEVVRKSHRDVSSQLAVGDFVFAADNKSMLSCHEIQSGKEIFNERIGNNNKSLASPLLIQNKLVFVLDDGNTAIVEPTSTLKLVRTNKLGEGMTLDFVASPAVVQGKLLIRSQSHLYCIGKK